MTNKKKSNTSYTSDAHDDEKYLNMSDRDLLIRIDERVKGLDSRVRKVEEKLISTSEHSRVVKMVDDHATRIDILENWKSKVIGISMTISALAGLLSSFILDLIKNAIK